MKGAIDAVYDTKEANDLKRLVGSIVVHCIHPAKYIFTMIEG